jgi:two-component system chemotaxis sensor kinase CheA
MSPGEEEFLKSLRATFKVEAAEHMETISTGLLELEKTGEPAPRLRIIESTFRAAHSLKGAARAVSFTDIESICQSLEDLFAAWKRDESLATSSSLDVAHRAMDKIAAAIAGDAPPSRAAQPSARQTPVQPAVYSPHTTYSPHASPATSTTPATPALASDPAAALAPSAPVGETETVRVTVQSLDTRLLEAEELLSAKLAANERAAELGTLASHLEQWRKECLRIQPQARALRRAGAGGAAFEAQSPSGVADFIDWSNDYLRSLEGKVTALRRVADQDRLAIGRLVDDLLENSKKLLMLPLATLGMLLPKMVRDLCRDQGKEADLVLRGEEVKLDKRILEEMKDPLIHLLRNCIDHGIEPPEQRRRAGKPARATIVLEVERVNGNKVGISVSDDGSGVDVEQVKAAAIKRGLIAAEAADRLPESAALDLVFEPDISTSPIITHVSGRGLGLAIVREKAVKLGGRVTIENRANAGTTVRMVLPLTLATFRGVLVEAAQRRFIVPTAQIERVIRFKAQDVLTVEGRNTLAQNGRTVALANLEEVLRLPPARHSADAPESTPALILGTGEQRIAFAVNAVLDEREVLVKPLTRPLSRVRNIAGATVLGSGEVAPILNVTDLLKSARQAGFTTRAPARAAPADTPAKKVLIAEDSITSRMLLKGILESAGYDVKIAVDGMEAFATLRAEHFDVLVSDVEMPRLNGFDLAARVRADRNLAELPIVLVTALESREDRERGIDVGASAYLVKSDLDQSNLLETLRRLA